MVGVRHLFCNNSRGLQLKKNSVQELQDSWKYFKISGVFINTFIFFKKPFNENWFENNAVRGNVNILAIYCVASKESGASDKFTFCGGK